MKHSQKQEDGKCNAHKGKNVLNVLNAALTCGRIGDIRDIRYIRVVRSTGMQVVGCGRSSGSWQYGRIFLSFTQHKKNEFK